MENTLNRTEDLKNVSNISAISNFPLIDQETRRVGPTTEFNGENENELPPGEMLQEVPGEEKVDVKNLDEEEEEEEYELEESEGIRDSDETEEEEEEEDDEDKKKKLMKKCCKKKEKDHSVRKISVKQGKQELLVANLRGIGAAHAFEVLQAKKATFWEIKKKQLINKYEKIMKKYFSKGIEPNNIGRLLWDMIATIFIMYNFLIIPFQIAFDLDDGDFETGFSYLIDVFFMIDLVLNFFTGYLERGTTVLDLKRIRRNYLKTWFLLDFISSFPTYIVIIEIYKEENNKSVLDFVRFIKLVRIFRLLRFIRLLKATRMRKFLAFLENIMNANQVFNSLLTLVFIIAMCAHWFGCIWHYIGVISLDSYTTNWLIKYNFQNDPIWDRYVSSVYWAVTTMSTVGYGDITPSNPYERLMCIIAMLLAGSIHAYVLNKIQDIIKGSGNTFELYQDDYKIVKSYMRKKKVPMAFQIKIYHYLQYAIEQENSLHSSHDVIYKYLSKTFRDLLLYETIGENILTTIVFKEFTEEFKVGLIDKISEKIYSPSEAIFFEEDATDLSYYFINKGTVRIFIHKTSTTLNKLEGGDHFGDIGFFSGVARTASAESLDFCSLYCIDRNKFIELLDKHPTDKQYFCQNRDLVSVYNDVKGLYLVCYICHESDHLAKDCPSLHYVVKKDAFIAKTYSNKRIPYERNRSIKKFYSYHILENRALLIQANLDNMTVYEYETESDVAPQPAETERMSTAALETEEAGASPVLRKTVSVVQDKDEMNIPLDLTEPGQNRNKRYPIEKYKIWPFEIGFDKIENFNHYFEHNNFKNITFIPSEHHVPEASILEEDDDDELLAHMNNGDNFLGL